MKILLIGGGTGGHIYPLKNLSEALLEKGAEVHILAAEAALDKKILNENFDTVAISFHFCKTGKIRRYFSIQNIKDLFQIFRAVVWARKFLKKHQFDVLFFKGGFVGFPVIVAAKFMFPRFQGQIFSHESDISAGLLTQFASKFSDKTFYSFGKNASPLFFSSRTKINEETTKLPSILVFGGSQGAEFINHLILTCAKGLLKKYHLTLITGIGKKVDLKTANFEQFELLEATELAQKIKESDLIISRGGANSLFEILENKKPSIIIPLPSSARDHQLKNARYFEDKNLIIILEQNESAKNKLVPLIESTMQDEKFHQALKISTIKNEAKKIAEDIMEY